MQAEAAAAFFERRDEIGEEAAARSADGVAERNGAAQPIDPVGIGTRFPKPREHGRGERLVDLEGVDGKSRVGIVTFVQYRHFFGQFQSGYLTHGLFDFARLSRRTPGAFDK
jgi:hypothetical protein